MSKTSTKEQTKRRKKRTRSKIHGTEERPRLSVYRSLNYTYAQVINDDEGHTLASADSREDFDLDDEVDLENKEKQAYLVGLKVAERAQEEGVDKIVFDRGPYKYHGRIEALAEGAREGGLEF
ncbi:MAG: 50S ribosomal protein L18 [Candidatus Magasanikbacteria bacterium]